MYFIGFLIIKTVRKKVDFSKSFFALTYFLMYG